MLPETKSTLVVQTVDAGIVHSKRKAPLTGMVGMPRSIRARVVKAQREAARPKRGKSGSPHSPNQEAAVSRSGHVALGPWTGPFAEATTASTPVYIDPLGVMYESLYNARSGTTFTVPAADAPSAKALLMAGKAAEAGRWDDTAAARTAELKRASRVQKPLAKWAAKRGGRSRRMNTVMQPRRMN